MEYMEDPEEFIEDEENFDNNEIDEDFDEFEYEDDCGEEECRLPKCAKPKKVSLTSLAGLKKHFDEVLLERTEFCNVLTLRDKANRPDYDWVVWLQVKIPFKGHNLHAGESDEQYIEGVCKKILFWVDLLRNFDKSENKQLSLFDDAESDECEPLPEQPMNESNGSWSKYFRECERIKVSNLKKKYSFFELFPMVGVWHSYHDPLLVQNWLDQLPKNNKEMIELVKDAIVKGTTSEKGCGRFDEFWWDDEYKYMTRDGALSDYEMIDRVKHLIRLYLVPYTNYFHVQLDDGFSSWEHEEKTDYRFWFDGRKIQGMSWLKNDDLPEYELYDEEFIDWLRDYFKIPHKDIISDDDILRENLIGLFDRSFNKDERSKFDIFDELKKAKNVNEFKAKALAHAKLGNGGGSGYSIDGFRGSYDLFQGKKGHVLTIRQSMQQRIDLGRNINGLEIDSYDNERVYVFKLTFVQALEKAYELFGSPKPKQLDLFDFLAA